MPGAVFHIEVVSYKNMVFLKHNRPVIHFSYGRPFASRFSNAASVSWTVTLALA